jgi:DNA gyrase subunit A
LRKGDRVVFVELVDHGTTMFIATQNARILHFKIKDVPVLSNPGIGVRGIRLVDGDQVLGAVQLSRPSDCLRVVNSNDKPLSFGQMKYGVTSRGGKGIKTSARNQFQQIVRSIELVDWTEMEEE